ncbi:3410_t:CDS:2 [Diversispora eburnea]|uniref:3410_t:CDS:1 n=1 Tax=Diversispora eburnea TaxID=1213867 RepID=A0A9N8WM68_9GLOM|nr:3410_t:CDS:2 [Diversispora eburnea]
MSIVIDVTSVRESSAELNNDNDKKISSDSVIQITCSPDIKYVATLNENDEIGIWKVEEHSVSFDFEKMCGISDEGLLNILYKGKTRNVKERVIFDLSKDRRALATFKSHVTDLKFLKNGYMVATEMSDNEKFAPFIGIKVYSIRKTHERIHLEVKHSMAIHPTTIYSSIDSKNFLSDGKFLFGYDLIQQWDIVNATFENNFHRNFAQISLTDDKVLSKYKEENYILMHLKKPNIKPLNFSPFYRLHNVDEMSVSSKDFDFLSIREIREDNAQLEFYGYYFVDIYETQFGHIPVQEKVISIIDNKPQMRHVSKEVMQQSINQFMSTHFLLSNNLPFINEIKGEKIMYGEFPGINITWKIDQGENGVTLSAIGDQGPIDTLILDKFLTIFNDTESINADSYIHSYLLPNDDLIIVTNYSLMFITATIDKIQILYYFPRDQFSLVGEMLVINIDSNFNVERFEFFLNNLDKKFEKRHPYKDMIMIYLNNIMTFNLYAANILAAAIITHRGDYIELIVDKCLEYYKTNPDQINIFRVVTSSLPKLKKSYPYYINKFLINTALIKAPHINKIYESKHSHLYTNPTIDLYIPLPGFASYSPTYNFYEEFFWKAEPNGFVKTIIPELYSDWAGEALINFKWKTFGRIYYIGIWILYTFFFLTFTLATTDFGILTRNQRDFLLKICVLLGIIQLYFELHFDPNNPDFDDPNSAWRLTTSFSTVFPDGNVSSTRTLIETPSSSTNLFESLDTAILAVFALMTGDYSSLSGWEMRNNATLSVLWISFLFLTGIYLLNMFIGLLNLGISNKDNYALFLTKKAKLIADIELFYLLPNQRRWRHWFPDHIYYHANVEEVQGKLLELDEINLRPDRQYKLHKPIIHHNLLKLINMDKKKQGKTSTLAPSVMKFDVWTQTD